MTGQRHKTTIEIDVDDRKIRGLDQTLHRTFDDRMLAAFERSIDRTATSMERMLRVAERLDRTMRRMPGIGGGAGGGRGGGGMAAGGSLGPQIAQLSQQIQQLARALQAGGGAGGGGGGARGGGGGFAGRTASTALGTYLGGLTAAAGGGQGIISQAAGGIPLAGGFLGGAIGAIQNYYQRYESAQTGISRQAGALGRRRPPRGAVSTMRGFGFDRPARMQQATQFAGAAGLSGEGVTPEFLNTAQRLQSLGGIDAAGVVGAMGVGRMGPRGQDYGASAPGMSSGAMMQAVSAGMQAGVREARLGQFVAAATSVLEQGRMQGVDLELGQVLQTVQGFAAAGEGFQGQRAQEAMSRAIPEMRSFRPGTDFRTLLRLRAAGFGRQGEGGRSYLEAMQHIQTRPAEQIASELAQIQQMGGGRSDVTAYMMSQYAPGATGSIRQARSLAGMGPEQRAAFGREVGTEGARDLLTRRAGALGGPGGGVFGAAAAGAGYRDRQLALGGRRDVGRAARSIRNTELALISSTIPTIAATLQRILAFIALTAGVTIPGGPSAESELEPDLVQRVQSLRRGEIHPSVGSRPTMGTPVPESVRRLGDRGPASGFEQSIQQFLHEHTGSASPEDIERRRQERVRERSSTETTTSGTPVTEGGGSSSLSGHLRDMAHSASQAAIEADRLGLLEEGALGMG